MKLSTACLMFKEALLRLYEERGIVDAFKSYLGFLSQIAVNDSYIQLTDWQIADLLMSIYNPLIDPSREALETAWSYTRRGGKSRDLTILAVFFSLLDFRVVWRAPYSDQLVQASDWFNMNPFVETQKIRTQFRVGVYGAPEISVGVLSEGRIASREADVLIYDEGGNVMNYHQNYDYYKNSRPMIAASKNKYIIHASTDCLGSVFNEELEALKIKGHNLGTRFTSIHTWRDTTWITEEWIEQEKKSHMDCSWYIDQNYNCVAVVRGGRIFHNIILVGHPSYPEFPFGCLDKILPTNGGVDFNGENVGHYLDLIAYNDNYVYVLDEINFKDLITLFDYENKVLLEVEEGLFNTAFTEQLSRMGLSAIYQQWNEELKHVRLQELVDRKIVIDQYRTPITYKNLLEAGWDENSPRPKLAKRTDQHGLDALLHAMNGVTGNIDVIARKGETSLFGKPIIQHIYKGL